ncbi:MAG: response regulator [Lysobacterales bacterium]|jgi:CheY-like chemotaxis protein
MKTIILTLILPGIILFVGLNIAVRELFRRYHEMKKQAEREQVLADSLRLDFSRESKTLKRVEVDEPVARILCVDDEEVILDSLRKILVLDGYSIDTVETGQEALGLVRSRDYDFVFTDLKMPAMSGTDVAKSVKHLRPDIDVIIITGFATVESAVECMKHGAMDYIEKPFSEDELRTFVRHALIRRQDRIEKQLKPQVQVIGPEESGRRFEGEFTIPGGVMVSQGHCWASLAEDGTARVGLDDFARKLLGRIDAIEFPEVGTRVQAGERLYTVRQNGRAAEFRAPLSGTVAKINVALGEETRMLDDSPYGRNWVCIMDGDNLDAELPKLKIGKSAVAFFQKEMDRFQDFQLKASGSEVADPTALRIGAMENLDDAQWQAAVSAFFAR